MKTDKIEQLLLEHGVNLQEQPLNVFIKNWAPESNYDYQQDYFLAELKDSIKELIYALNQSIEK